MQYVEPFSLQQGTDRRLLLFSGGDIGDSIERIGGGRAYELAPLSISHADQAALYQAGMLEELGVDTNLSDEARQAARAHYRLIHNTKGIGNWNRDGVWYDVEIDKPCPKGYANVLWVPEWTIRDGKWIIKSDPFIAQLPPNGYGPVPTAEGGLRDPRTGWALKTDTDRGKAVDALAEYFFRKLIGDEAKARKVAAANVSYSHRREPGQGKAAVFRFRLLDDGGPFGENAYWDGNLRSELLGVIPLQ